MTKLHEVLERANITHDNKARRVLNTAPTVRPNVELDEIQRGVTIERLESLNVPVYQYATQITIHGRFHHIDTEYLRVNGYKSVIANQNKSIGVRYIAIDAEKKSIIQKALYYAGNQHGWHMLSDSTGYIIRKTFHDRNAQNPEMDKQQCMNLYHDIPDHLYIGTKIAGMYTVWGMYAGFGVEIQLGAIYQANLWTFIGYLCGIKSETELNERMAQKQERDRIDQLERERKRAEAKAQRQQIIQNAIDNFIPPAHWQRYTGITETNKTYARITVNADNQPEIRIVKTKNKRGNILYDCEKVFPITPLDNDDDYVNWESHVNKSDSREINGWIIPCIQSSPDAESTNINSNVSIHHNTDKNGIEIKFGNKPDNDILQMLKNNGFRWSMKSKLWYAKYTDSLYHQMHNVLIGNNILA